MLASILLALWAAPVAGANDIAAPSIRPVLGKRVKPRFAPTTTDFILTFPSAPGGTITANNGQAVTFVRASSMSCPVGDGSTFETIASNVVCARDGKVLVEGPTTNYALHSEDITQAAWGCSSGDMNTSANVAPFADGLTSMDRVEKTANAAAACAQSATATATSSAAFSVWARAESGTTTVSAAVRCSTGTQTQCFCGRSDGGSCTTSTTGTYCRATATVGTTPVRVRASVHCPASTTALHGLFSPGAWNTDTTGVAIFGGAQLEGWTTDTTYVKTGAATAARASTKITTDSSSWPLYPAAVEIDFTPSWQTAFSPGTDASLTPENMALACLATTFVSLGDGWATYISNTSSAWRMVSDVRTPTTAATSNVAMTWLRGTQYRLLWRSTGYTAGSTNSMWRDGVAVLTPAATRTQTTSGIQSPTGKIGFIDSGGGMRWAWGWLGPRYCIGQTSAGCQ